MKIRSSSLKIDGERNPSTYFIRKVFFAINIKVIADRYERVMWRSIISKGSEHDSAAFKNTHLSTKLSSLFTQKSLSPLRHEGIQLYIIGDSAHALRPFLLTPYDSASPKSKEDVFNFMLSSNRIFIECCFEEINARCALLWKPLVFDLKRDKFIIDACMRLYIFLCDYRIEHEFDREWREDKRNYNDDCVSFMVNKPDNCIETIIT